MLADVREHDGAVWVDDSVELFIDPTNQRKIDGYMQLAVNAIGTTYEARGDEHTAWDPTMRVGVRVGKKAWTAEWALPLKELVADPTKLNRVWAVNFNRMAYLIDGTEDTAWSPVFQTDSHQPAKFGCLWLDAATVDNTK